MKGINMTSHIILVTYQMCRIIDNRVIQFIRQMDMAHKLLQNNMIILKILLVLVNKCMLNMIFHITQVICLMFKTTDSKVIQFIRQMDMDLKTSQNNMTILKILLVLVNRCMLNMTCHTILEIFQTFKITDSKVIPSTKQMDMDPKTSQNNMTILKILLVQENKFMHNMISHTILETCQMYKIIDNKVIPFTKQMVMDHKI